VPKQPQAKPTWDGVEIDHLAYLSDRRHRREVHANLRRAARKPGGAVRQEVIHEWDGRCCAIESWPRTAIRIQRALGDDGVPACWVFAGGRSALVAFGDAEEGA